MAALNQALRSYSRTSRVRCKAEKFLSTCIKRQNGYQACYINHQKRFYSADKRVRPVVSSTTDEEELKKFQALSHTWWDETGEMGMLHRMNKLRVPLIRDGLMNQRDTPASSAWLPLEGISIVDAGCGGGVLTEPLARLGAFVIGVDAVEECINVAEAHLSEDISIQGRVKYIHGSVEDLVQTEREKFDAVVSSEVVEHVADLDSFLDSCCQLVKPEGSIFITTINKTVLSRGLAVFAAERILRLVPAGTHDWEKFVPPDDLKFLLSQRGFSTQVIHGMFYNPATSNWSWIENTAINYALHAVKSSSKTSKQGR